MVVATVSTYVPNTNDDTISIHGCYNFYYSKNKLNLKFNLVYPGVPLIYVFKTRMYVY